MDSKQSFEAFGKLSFKYQSCYYIVLIPLVCKLVMYSYTGIYIRSRVFNHKKNYFNIQTIQLLNSIIKKSAMKYISTLHSIITLGSSYIFRNNYNTYLQFHKVYCRDVIQHKVQVTTDIVYSTSQLHVMLLV